MTTDQKNLPNRKIKRQVSPKTFIRYSSLAFEMIFIILAGVFGGIKLDELFNTKPFLTALLSLAGVVLAVFYAIKDFLRKPKNGAQNIE